MARSLEKLTIRPEILLLKRAALPDLCQAAAWKKEAGGGTVLYLLK
jgi:hypothetical protein